MLNPVGRCGRMQAGFLLKLKEETMAKTKRYATATINEPIGLGQSGITIVIWDKYGKTRRGTARISVGGIRWFPYKKKKARPIISWDKLDEMY